MVGWNMGCKHAPLSPVAKHCRMENQGDVSVKKAHSRGRSVGKGFFGCARHCRFFAPKEVGK